MDNLINSPIDNELSKLSPFELKGKIIEMADEKVKKAANSLLNAGRGNPNWVSDAPRSAFFAFGQFAMTECHRTLSLPEGIAGTPQKGGMAARFETWMRDNASMPGVDFLRKAYEYCLMELSADPDALLDEWADGIVGDNYPTPPRILHYTEVIVRKYLDWAICSSNPPKDVTFDLFAVEGSTAGMCYCFDVLKQNHLLEKGDAIAIMVPVFTPYIEIPELNEFEYTVLDIDADATTPDGLHTWQYKRADIEKLKDPKYKMLFVTNPSNPPSYAMAPETVEALKEVVKANPRLMILTDDVYGTFVKGYRSLAAELPYNSISCYSFSKYFGATGWRVAVTAVSSDNVFDKLISELPDDKKAILARRYSSLTLDPSGLKFIDRLVADSRLVGLNHTAGLSTPQQVQMALFSAMAYLHADELQPKLIEIIHRRLHDLWSTTGFTLLPDPNRAGYYSEIDLMVWAKKFYGEEFADYLDKNYEPIDFVIRMANQTAIVLLNGDGFDGPKWSVRASLANLDRDAYLSIGTAIRHILDQYHGEYIKATSG